MSTSHCPNSPSTASVAGEPLMNCRFVPAAVQHKITGRPRRFARKLPFFAGRKSGTATAAKAGIRNNFDDFFRRALNSFRQRLVTAAGAVLLQPLASFRRSMRKENTVHELHHPRIEKLIDEFFQG